MQLMSRCSGCMPFKRKDVFPLRSSLKNRVTIKRKLPIESTYIPFPINFVIKKLSAKEISKSSSTVKSEDPAIMVKIMGRHSKFKELIRVNFTVSPSTEPINFTLLSPIPSSLHKDVLEVEEAVLERAKTDGLYQDKFFTLLEDTVVAGLTGACYPDSLSKDELFAMTLCMAHLFKNDDYWDENGEVDPKRIADDIKRKKEVLETGKIDKTDNKTTEYMLMLSQNYPGIFKKASYEYEYFRYLQNTHIEAGFKKEKRKIPQHVIDLVRPLASGSHLALVMGICLKGIDISKVYSSYPEIETMLFITAICIGKGNDLVSNKETRRVLSGEESSVGSLNSVISNYEDTKLLQASYSTVAEQFNGLVEEVYSMRHVVNARLETDKDTQLKEDLGFILDMIDRWLSHQTTWSPFIPRYNRQRGITTSTVVENMREFMKLAHKRDEERHVL